MATTTTTTTNTDRRHQYISLELDASTELRDCKHAAHCLLYSSADCSGRHLVLLQMRFDGLLGFAGGEVEVADVTVADIVDATNRELEEEINYRFDGVTRDDWICTHRDSGSPFVQHFFAKELTADQLRQLETTHTTAEHFPCESLGLFRVPIGGFDQKGTSRKFLINFLGQRFAGNARQQFIETVKKLSLVSDDDLKWMESHSELTTDSGLAVGSETGIEIKTLLRTDLDVHYYDESVNVTYGLMIVREDGLFDFVGRHYVSSGDNVGGGDDTDSNRKLWLQSLRQHIVHDLGKDIIPLEQTTSDVISVDNNLCHIFDIQLSDSHFCQIETNLVESTNYGCKVFGIFRVPLVFRGSTSKANQYVQRFFNGFLSQRFAGNSRNHIKHIYDK
ncbi:uncharacterized protein LOC128961217 [Oppia nitens]|uniref:uncharacterized protein LOC128961217 n=1 Tax=Oppia nitens TaxID=1686743 RepID=UPI0023DC9EDD|nr:uncharacterized protein LOC128961217 [Oppia nitens]XP_054163407.1 uncharacterized protein LOC128961217 [Oppia nitens]